MKTPQQTTEMTLQQVLAENARRNALLPENAPYDPERGIGCHGDRVPVSAPFQDYTRAYVPRSMTEDPEYAVAQSPQAWIRLRCRHDFEFWCRRCVTITYKGEGREGPFILNIAQRQVLAVLEEDRLAGRPLRIIILKARQWGGSTLVQMYMAWIQAVLRRNWNSLICAHLKDTAATIRGMYSRMLAGCPPEYWHADEPPAFRPYERSANIREIAGRACRVTVTSAESQDSIRGADIAMAHLSEVAFYPFSPKRSPEDLLRAVMGSIAYEPLTLVAIESTANGVGNFFHREWLRAQAGQSDKHAIFIPWHRIEKYRLPVSEADAQALWTSMSPYERNLWDSGLTLEMIHWHRMNSRAYPSADCFHAEYPTTPAEAFALSGAAVFAPQKIERLRQDVKDPVFTGEITAAATLAEDPKGDLQIWEDPAPATHYVAAVDIGGRSPASDFSVISVLTRSKHPRVVAQWRGHIDHDLLADKAMQIGHLYNTALLVVESNSLESENPGAGADFSLPVLERLIRSYPSLYRRQSVDTYTGTITNRVGFHTNRRTKPLLITHLISAVREGTYTERSAMACDELMTYAQMPNGAYAARPGCHDDILMSRAMAIYVIGTEPLPIAPGTLPPPRRILGW